MTTPLQPSLFDDAVLAEARLEAFRQPATCPACGTVETNGWLLEAAHGYRPDGSTPRSQGRMCIAQIAAHNRLTFQARYGGELAAQLAVAAALGVDTEPILRNPRDTELIGWAVTFECGCSDFKHASPFLLWECPGHDSPRTGPPVVASGYVFAWRAPLRTEGS